MNADESVIKVPQTMNNKLAENETIRANDCNKVQLNDSMKELTDTMQMIIDKVKILERNFHEQSN
jgi:hypothetical protein